MDKKCHAAVWIINLAHIVTDASKNRKEFTTHKETKTGCVKQVEVKTGRRCNAREQTKLNGTFHLLAFFFCHLICISAMFVYTKDQKRNLLYQHSMQYVKKFINPSSKILNTLHVQRLTVISQN